MWDRVKDLFKTRGAQIHGWKNLGAASSSNWNKLSINWQLLFPHAWKMLALLGVSTVLVFWEQPKFGPGNAGIFECP